MIQDNKTLKNKYRKLVPNSTQNHQHIISFNHLRKTEQRSISKEDNHNQTIQSLNVVVSQHSLNQHKKKRLRTITSIHDKEPMVLKSSASVMECVSVKVRQGKMNHSFGKEKEKIQNLMMLVKQFRERSEKIEQQVDMQMDTQLKEEVEIQQKIEQILISSKLSAAKLIKIYLSKLKLQYQSYIFQDIYSFARSKQNQEQQHTQKHSIASSLEEPQIEESYIKQQYIGAEFSLDQTNIKRPDRIDQGNKHSKINENRHKNRQNLLNINKFLQIL